MKNAALWLLTPAVLRIGHVLTLQFRVIYV
jgi:hypothetical protein